MSSDVPGLGSLLPSTASPKSEQALVANPGKQHFCAAFVPFFRATFMYEQFPELMNMLWTRMLKDNKKNWRRVYKVCKDQGLVLVQCPGGVLVQIIILQHCLH